jgi:hypothetical protein
MTLLGPRHGRKGLTKLEPVGNCVVCGHRIIWGEPYVRVPGRLGKTCTECAEGR